MTLWLINEKCLVKEKETPLLVNSSLKINVMHTDLSIDGSIQIDGIVP